MSATRRASASRGQVTLVRAAIVGAVLIGWEALAESGLLFRDVVP